MKWLCSKYTDLLKRPDRFDPSPLVQVGDASIDSGGMLGWTGSPWIVDVHHRAWPGRGSRRSLLIGFTSHYDKMCDRFRDLPLGAAGENIVVACDWVVSLDQLGDRIVIRSGDGRRAVPTNPTVARPCLLFASLMLGLPVVATHQEIGEDRASLDEGIHGFHRECRGACEPFRLRVGDELLRG